jgi:molecular chaperone GrpE
MDEKHSQKKPLRTAANKMKDIYNTYVKNDESRPMGIYLANDEKVQVKDEVNSKLEEKVMFNDNQENTQTIETKGSDDSLIIELNDKINQLEIEKEELKDQVMRKTAEVENIRRRSIKEKQEMIDYANEKLLLKFLGIYDDFTNAISHANQSSDYDSLLKGIELIYSKLIKTLEESGVTQIENSAGKEFDVNTQEALAMLASDLPENFVIQEIQAGFMMHNKVLRHTKVITSSGVPNVE